MSKTNTKYELIGPFHRGCLRYPKDIPRKLILLIGSFVLFFGEIWPGGFSTLVFSSEKEITSLKTLEALKIEAVKRELRLPLNTDRNDPFYISIEKGYGENRFVFVVNEIELRSKEKSADIALIYGNALFFLGRREAAVAAYQDAFRQAASSHEKAAAMANFGFILSKEGKWQAAADWLERALDIDRKHDDWTAQGNALSRLGTLYFQLGDTTKGVSFHIEALEVAETIPIIWLEARQLYLLGNLYYLDGILHIAQDYFEKAIEISRRLGDPLGEASALSGLSFVFKDRNAFDLALDRQSEALSIYQALNDLPNETKGLINLSLIYRDQGDFQSALELGAKVFLIQKKLGNLNGMAEIEGTIGTIYQKKGDLNKAIVHLEKARKHFQEAGASQQIHIVELRIQALQDQLK